MDTRDYLELEHLLREKISTTWAKIAPQVFEPVQSAIDRQDYLAAREAAQMLDCSAVGEQVREFAYMMYRGFIDFGAQQAAQGESLTSSLDFDQTVSGVVTQFLRDIEWNITLQAQTQALQLIAEAETVVKSELVQKARPLKPLVSFQAGTDRRLQMVATLHASRLSNWGYVAEADLRGETTYKISAMLDNRTSDFCRMIHGKTFTVESARPLVNASVHADDPNDLKTIQPWPDQSKAGIAEIKGLTDDELVARGLHIPPYHPGCRTLMIAVSTRAPLTKPVIEQTIIPEQLVSVDSFTAMGVKMTPDQVDIWNDYIRLNPMTTMKALTGKDVVTLLGSDDWLLKVTAKGNIRIKWAEHETLYNPVTGVLEYKSVDGMGAYSKASTGILAYGQSIGATKMVVRVAPGEALDALSAGFTPSTVEWLTIRDKLKKLVAGTLAGSYAGLSNADKTLLNSVLNSNIETQMAGLAKLPAKFAADLLEGVKYSGNLAFA